MCVCVCVCVCVRVCVFGTVEVFAFLSALTSSRLCHVTQPCPCGVDQGRAVVTSASGLASYCGVVVAH